MTLVYSPDMETLADDILAGALQNKDERNSVFTSFAKELFRNENYLIYSVLLHFREQNLVPDAQFLDIFLHRNQEVILKDNGTYIDTTLFDTNNDLLDEVIASTIATLDDLTNKEVNEEFIESLPLKKQEFKELYKTSAVNEVMDNVNLIIKDNLKIGRKVLSGVDDASEYFNNQMVAINALVSEESQVLYNIKDVNIGEDQDSMRHIGDFGDLQFLTDHFGGIYTQMFYSVMAPTKGGKSKFCYRMMHNVSVINGNSVLMWPAEGGKEKAKAELRAIHYVYYWETVRGKPLPSNAYLSANNIYRGVYPDDHIKELELESNADLNNNPDYGSINFIESPMRADNYMDMLTQTCDKTNPDLLIVDYLQLLLPAESGVLAKQSKSERIGQAYVETLSFIKNRNMAFITPAQMKQDAIKDLSAGKEFDTRTLGGESSEIVRTPDYNIALYGSPEDIENGYMRLLSIPSREAEPFSAKQIGVNLGFSYFYDAE